VHCVYNFAILVSMSVINDYDQFKSNVTDHIEAAGITRSGLARKMEADGILRAHTVRCLLGTPGTVIGQRKPAFDSVIKIAHAAGFDVILRARDAQT
jgi:hypothetical protein